MTEQDFREHVQRQVDETCGSAGALARRLKVHPKSLTLFLSGARGPSAELAAAFGYQRLYAPIASLSPTPTVSDMGVEERPPDWTIERDPNGEAMVCTGCGTTRTVDHIRYINPSAFTCCPERKMIPVRDALASLTADKPDTQGDGQ